jgi:carboxymethylenebutenolidase
MNAMIDIPTNKGKVKAYESRPDGECRGGVIVIHEVWGLVEHTKDIANRFTAEGYLAVAPDLLSESIDVVAAGALQEDLFNPEKRNATQPRLREIMSPLHNPSFAADTTTKLKGIFNYLYELPGVRGRVAVVGFCFGGTYSFTLAVDEPRLKLAVPFYGHANYTAAELSEIKCPVRAFYGENDENLIKDLPELTEKMRSAEVDFEAKVYPDAGHAFFNDTNKFAYNQAAADDAWPRVLEYLETYVG